jgi:hypothetical protein
VLLKMKMKGCWKNSMQEKTEKMIDIAHGRLGVVRCSEHGA